MFEQVTTQKFYMQIVSQIRNRIDKGELKSGDKLPPEKTLAQQFGTSRSSIREALSALELLGFVESRSGHGNFIKTDGTDTSTNGGLFKELVKDHSAYEIFETRLELEPSIAALAAQRASKKEIRQLELRLTKLNEIGLQVKLEPRKAEEYMEEDRYFHLQLAKSARNNVLYLVFSGVNLMMKERRWSALKKKLVLTEGNLKKYEKEHTTIFNAIKAGNSTLAKNAMHKHILDIRKELFD
jgi:GntR family transcriptional repressor for pyruvate dehydrogenase complex